MNKNLDYCGVLNLLRQLLNNGCCTEKELRKIATRIAAQWGVDIVIFF